ncbi:MAG: hypothetical protein WBA76_21245 [Phormidesmis sp.]
MKRILGVGLPTFGLIIGFLCLGRAVFVGAAPTLETALTKTSHRSNKSQTIAAGLLLGIPCMVGSLWMLRAFKSNHELIQSQRIQMLFYKAVKANEGSINPLQLAMLAEITVEDAKTFLEAWSGPLAADCQTDETGLTVYRFSLLKADRPHQLEP